MRNYELVMYAAMTSTGIQDLTRANFTKCWDKQVSQIGAIRLDLQQFREMK